jgi:hypothetical protein
VAGCLARGFYVRRAATRVEPGEFRFGNSLSWAGDRSMHLGVPPHRRVAGASIAGGECRSACGSLERKHNIMPLPEFARDSLDRYAPTTQNRKNEERET